MRIILIGPQGSGKGTQAELLSEKLEIPHISTGDLFRSLQGPLKQKVDETINTGKLVPDDLTLKILKQRLEKEDCKKGFILDGFPRNPNQVKLLKKITNIDKVIVIDVSDELAIKRLSSRLSCKKCGAVFNKITKLPKKENNCDHCNGLLIQRGDDTEQAVKKRLEIYHKETQPIIKEYKDKIIRVNGDRDIENISKEILEKLQ
jgi:adenylate kinase